MLSHEDFTAAGDVYYASVSAAYKVIQRILWLVFVFFMIFSVIINYREITYDNFFYLIKDMSASADSSATNYETLSYESDSRQSFALYRGGLASVSPSKISVFTATGKRTLNSQASFSAPYMVSSNKYVLVYDTSGKTFSIYNSFARVYTETLEYPITDACLTEDGSFAIVTRSADSRSIICVYNRNFKRTAELRTDYYMFDIAANKSRDSLAFVSYDAGNGTGRTVLSVRGMFELEELKKIELEGEFPLGCGFLDGNKFALITDKSIRVFDKDFEQIDKSIEYSGGNITGFSMTEEGAAVSVTLSSKNTVIVFDKSGKLLYNEAVSFNASDICVYDTYVFLQTDGGVVRIDTKNGIQEHLNSGRGKMLVYNAKTVLVCGESKAEYLIFDE